MVVLAVAVLTGSTLVALVVIVLAMGGLLLLARDWLKQRPGRELSERAHGQPGEDAVQMDGTLNPDMFEPDVSYDEAIESAAEHPAEPPARQHGIDVDDEGRGAR